ncbi:CocE/NonD family hydrolase [Microbacterium sediminicola]|uniref:CocE/NonD family hydrolase n=1 Tax=Microbacterium sediminicola TaxID=415210 RepID=A0ABP4UG81_9MICO
MVSNAAPEWVVENNVAVPTRDGANLRVNVYRPTGTEPVPVILSAHPYGKDAIPANTRSGRGINRQYRIMPQPETVHCSAWTGWEAPDPAFWVPRGYAVINADARGAGASDGTGELFSAQEADDYEDLISWAGTQPWSTGKVGLEGVSYLALSQYGVASRNPEHLAAICPWEGFTDLYRDFVWPGGVRENGFSVMWAVLTSRAARLTPPLRRALAAHPTRDAWYRERTPEIEKIAVPMLVCGSFSDHNLHSRGSFEAFRRVGEAAADPAPKWLYTHRGGKWSTYYGQEAAQVRARFFDHTLRGLDNGWDALPSVRLAVHETGAAPAAVSGEASWPPAGLTVRELCLDVASGTLSEGSVLTPAASRLRLRGPGLEWRWRLAEDTDIIGPAALRLFLSVEGCPDLSLFVGLRKISAGQVVPFEGSFGFDRAWMSYGWQRAGYRAPDPNLATPLLPVHRFDDLTRLSPGDVVPVDIELREHATRMRAGDELRLVVRGKWHHSRNPFTGQFPAGYRAQRRGAAVIHTGPDNPALLRVLTRPTPGEDAAAGDPWLG